MLWQVVKDILEILNCDVNTLGQDLFSENKTSGPVPVGKETPGEPPM